MKYYMFPKIVLEIFRIYYTIYLSGFSFSNEIPGIEILRLVVTLTIAAAGNPFGSPAAAAILVVL